MARNTFLQYYNVQTWLTEAAKTELKENNEVHPGVIFTTVDVEYDIVYTKCKMFLMCCFTFVGL